MTRETVDIEVVDGGLTSAQCVAPERPGGVAGGEANALQQA